MKKWTEEDTVWLITEILDYLIPVLIISGIVILIAFFDGPIEQ